MQLIIQGCSSIYHQFRRWDDKVTEGQGRARPHAGPTSEPWEEPVLSWWFWGWRSEQKAAVWCLSAAWFSRIPGCFVTSECDACLQSRAAIIYSCACVCGDERGSVSSCSSLSSVWSEEVSPVWAASPALLCNGSFFCPLSSGEEQPSRSLRSDRN